jgi:uncharacterized delta-60 repeat protein
MAIATLFLVALGSNTHAGQDSKAQAPGISAAAVSSGSLDTAFNKSGKLFQGFTTSGGGFATKVVTLPDGKAIVAYELQEGTLGDPDFRTFIVVQRLNEDGSLDRTFGGPGNIQATIKGFMPVLQPRSMVVTPEGGIFIAAAGFNTAFSFARPVILALTASGTLDSNFAGDGSLSPVTTIANPSTNKIVAEDLLYDSATNKLTLGGTIEPKNGNNSFLWTYTVDVNNTNITHETVVKEPNARLQFAKFRKVPGDELLIAAGMTPSVGGGLPRAYLVRQLDNGIVTGKALNVVGLETFITGLQVDGSKAFLAGTAYTNGAQTQGYVARFDLETLTRDTNFGSNGIRFVSNDVRDLAFSEGSGTAKKVIVVGSDGTDYMAARMSYNGQIDTSFGTNGIALVNFSNSVDERALTVSVDSKDRIWGAGLTEPFNDSGFRAGEFRLLP